MRITIEILKDGYIRFSILLVLLVISFPTHVNALVVGPCANCHTMHNSQNNAPVTAGEKDNLLKFDCIGCHSSTTDQSIVNSTPIVWNINSAPTQELAGGNFFYVASIDNSKDNFGHNVSGISPPDATLTRAPGDQLGCAESCHVSLAITNTNPTNGGKNGCEGCHLNVGHHVAHSDSILPQKGPIGGPGDAFRFLSGHGGGVGNVNNGPDGAFEDPDWGATPAEFNIYWTEPNPFLVEDAKDPMPIARFCGGCHSQFHAFGEITSWGPVTNGGGSRDEAAGGASWLRHPNNVVIPSDGEYAILQNDPYNPDIPVARSFLGRTAIEPGDSVMCLSCHKAHGSQYENMLRWDPASMDAHNDGSRTDGCFFCHRGKDDL